MAIVIGQVQVIMAWMRRGAVQIDMDRFGIYFEGNGNVFCDIMNVWGSAWKAAQNNKELEEKHFKQFV